MTNSESAQGSSNPCNVPETLRSIVREGNAWPSAGIISEAANLLDDADTLLGRLAECFGDDETEFADIKLMRDRIADVDTRARHDATDDSARAHGNETGERRPFAGLKSLSFDVSETPTIALVIRFDNIEHAQAARDQLWQPPTQKASEPRPCPIPEADGFDIQGKEIGPGIWGVGKANWHPESGDWRGLADINGSLCVVTLKVTPSSEPE